MPRTSVTGFIQARPQIVADLYRNWIAWPTIFGATIRGVHLLETSGNHTRLAVDHRVGRVINVLTEVGPDRVDLWEEKPRYTALFENHFEAEQSGTRMRVVAEVRLVGALRILGPLLGPYIRHQIRTYVIDPLRRAAGPTYRGRT